MANIGEPLRRIELEPFPDTEPVREPVPSTPAPAREPEPSVEPEREPEPAT